MTGGNGLRGIRRKLKAAVERLRQQAIDAEFEAARHVVSAAVVRAPRDTGDLRASSFVVREGNLVAFGFTAWYANIVHERLDVYHPIGEAKFLERAINDSAIQAELKRTLHGKLSRALSEYSAEAWW